MIGRRKFFLRAARHIEGLPEGYTAVEYIQSSGTQYIDTIAYSAYYASVGAVI